MFFPQIESGRVPDQCMLMIQVWLPCAGLMSFGDVLAPKVAPSQDMLDAEFQGLEGTETEGQSDGQDSSLSEDFNSFDMDEDTGE